MESIREAYVVEDWDISNLRLGEAIIGFPGQRPFIFRFEQYKPRKENTRGAKQAKSAATLPVLPRF